MAKRKSTSKTKTRKKSRKTKTFNSTLVKALGGLTILLLVVAIAGLLAHFLIPQQKPSKTDLHPKKMTKNKQNADKITQIHY